MDLQTRLDELKDLIESPDFLAGRGLSNEVNIRIFAYDPVDELTVRHFVRQLVTAPLGCNIRLYNLYDLLLAICDERRITAAIPGLEAKKGSAFLRDQLSRIAGSAAFVEKMKCDPCAPGDVILITGVGDAFPFIRIHDLLNAMQPEFPDTPIVVMYPGSYDGRDVQLFSLLPKNAYYRAFSVI